MNFDIGLPPIALLFVAISFLAIISDFLLELYSVRVSQATGRLQNWIFDHFGQSSTLDLVLALLFQFFSFRKKAFLLQLSSLVNVGSFTKKQCLMILLGSQIGAGVSLLLLMPGSVFFGSGLCVFGFILSLFWKDQVRDLGVGVLGWGLFLTSVGLFDSFLSDSTLNIYNLSVNESLVFAIVFLTALLFRTPVAFLLSMALFQMFVGINLLWWPVLFFLYGLISQLNFYGQIFQGRQRLYGLLFSFLSIQLLQLSLAWLFCWVMQPELVIWVQPGRFLDAFQLAVVAYFIYQSLSLVVLSPLFMLLSFLPWYNRIDEKKPGNQKIINIDQRGQCFSIHMALFLLRQEFKKYTTSVHTIFKLSRESDYEEEAINQKFVHYQGILARVGDELKELCFSIGRQRSYRWQVKEIMSYYKIVNQLELLVDDLSLVAAILREKDLDEDWEKECRYWLGLQLKLFESFFHYSLGVGRDDPEKVMANIDKSYDLLDRFFANKKEVGASRITSQTFYRITESIGNLAI